MRPSHALSLALILAAPLAAQSNGELTAHLNDGGGSIMSFEVNKPAYTAIFDVTRTSIRLVYPYSAAQSREVRATVQARAGTMMAFSEASFTGNDFLSNHTLVLVASSQPLRLGTPWTTPELAGHSIERAGYFGNMDSPDAIDALIDFVSPSDTNAEVATDEFRRTDETAPVVSFASFGPSLCAVCSSIPSASMAASRPRVDSTMRTAADSGGMSAQRVHQRTVNSLRIDRSHTITDPTQIRAFMTSVNAGAGNSAERGSFGAGNRNAGQETLHSGSTSGMRGGTEQSGASFRGAGTGGRAGTSGGTGSGKP